MGPFLDLFSGTVAVGVEAWSRGYDPVIAVENHPEALACAMANVKGTEVRVLRKDARRLEHGAFSGQAVLFCDPPYARSEALWVELAPRLRAWIAPAGVLVWEAPDKLSLPEVSGWREVDSRRYGAARFHFLEPH
jgi:16S rRNA (guanine966-N2)-methyltransferase